MHYNQRSFIVSDRMTKLILFRHSKHFNLLKIHVFCEQPRMLPAKGPDMLLSLKTGNRIRRRQDHHIVGNQGDENWWMFHFTSEKGRILLGSV